MLPQASSAPGRAPVPSRRARGPRAPPGPSAGRGRGLGGRPRREAAAPGLAEAGLRAAGRLGASPAGGERAAARGCGRRWPWRSAVAFCFRASGDGSEEWGCVCSRVSREALGLEPFSFLTCGARKPFQRFPRGGGRRSSPSSLGPVLPAAAAAKPRARGVSARRPGHLSRQLRGSAGACAVWSVPFPRANRGGAARVPALPLPAPQDRGPAGRV